MEKGGMLPSLKEIRRLSLQAPVCRDQFVGAFRGQRTSEEAHFDGATTL